MLASRTRQQLAACILGGWVLIIVTGFWWFELRWIRPFLDQVALFNGEQLSQNYAQASNSITVMHFGDANCPCNRFNFDHVRDIQQHYQPHGVRFVAWQVGQSQFPLTGFDEVNHTPIFDAVPATPSVAVWSADGELAYFGPYSSGLLCSLGDGFAETILDQLQAGQHPQVINTTGVGCFCPTRA